MPEIEQMPDNSYEAQQNVETAETNHKKTEMFVLVFIVLLLVAVVAFFLNRSGPEVAGECTGYASDTEVVSDAVAKTRLDLCNCIADGDMKYSCEVQVNDMTIYKSAILNLEPGECEKIQDDTSRASCVLAVQDKVAYIKSENGAQVDSATDFAAKYEENPKDVNNIVNLALSYGSQDKITQARVYLEEAKVLEPKNAKIYVAEGYLFALEEENDKAIESYTKAIQLDVESIEALMNRAKTYTNMGMTSEAIADYEKATLLDTSKMYSDTIIHRELCRLYIETEDTVKAEEKCDIVLTEEAIQEAKTIIQ